MVSEYSRIDSVFWVRDSEKWNYLEQLDQKIRKNEIIKYNQKQNDNSEKPIISVKNGLWIGEKKTGRE